MKEKQETLLEWNRDGKFGINLRTLYRNEFEYATSIIRILIQVIFTDL